MTASTQLLLQPAQATSETLTKQVLEELIAQGVEEFCLCPGARNAPLIYALVHASQVRLYYWSEERSAAFFALGRIKATGRPVAVVTTSGTAAAELLPAVMEAYYTALPLILLTADRPSRFRGTGAPQSAEQIGLFSCYVHDMQDLEIGKICYLNHWKRQGPVHLNVCFEEPQDLTCQTIRIDSCQKREFIKTKLPFYPDERYLAFLQNVHYPLVIVGALPISACEEVMRFLLHLKAPVYAEGISGIREDPRLAPLQMTCMEEVWKVAAQQGYPIDGVLRLGSVPTARLWRDLENLSSHVQVCSISEQPFSGLSCADVIHTSLISFAEWALTIKSAHFYAYQRWKERDMIYQNALQTLFQEEPQAEASLIHALSKKIPLKSKVYLGNSLPIREWDQAATYQARGFQMACNRGVNGIDGQISTFLGYSSLEQDNWALLGDLTVLYDLVAPWIASQLSPIVPQVVVVNNGGARIFKQMFAHPAFQHTHHLNFEPLARFWGWQYEKWDNIPTILPQNREACLIELIPQAEATERFLQRINKW